MLQCSLKISLYGCASLCINVGSKSIVCDSVEGVSLQKLFGAIFNTSNVYPCKTKSRGGGVSRVPTPLVVLLLPVEPLNYRSVFIEFIYFHNICHHTLCSQVSKIEANTQIMQKIQNKSQNKCASASYKPCNTLCSQKGEQL